MQIWAYPNYRNSDIATIAIAIVIYYRDISHYRYCRSALVKSICVCNDVVDWTGDSSCACYGQTLIS